MLGIGASAVLSNTVAAIQIRDAGGNDASSKFFVLVTSDPLGATHGGTVSGQGSVSWQLIPNADAGGTSPQGTQYTVWATFDYVVGGTSRSASTQTVTITVLPSPKLTVAYTVPFVVMAGKDALVRVTVQNVGHGPARNFSIESMQPRIVESIPADPLDQLLGNPGPLVNFFITGSSNTADGTGFQAGNLTVNFGDVPAGGSVSGYWTLRASRKGFFIDVSSTFVHADYNGVELDPLVLPPTIALIPAIGGEVTGSAGQGVPALTVSVSQDGTTFGIDQTDHAGTYYIPDLVAGTYLEEVRDLTGAVLVSKTITIPGDQATDFINFSLPNFEPTLALVLIQSEQPGVPFTADGVSYTTPHSFVWEIGSTHTLGAPNSNSDSVFVGWTDGETSGTRTLMVGPTGAILQPQFRSAAEVNQYSRTQVTTDPVDHKWPSMNNLGDMVWSQRVGGFWQVFKQEASTNNAPVQVTSGQLNHERPVISDDGTIVWFQDGTGSGLGYAIARLDRGASTPSIVEFSSRSRSECNPRTGECFTPQERAAGKTFGIDSTGRTISFYTFYEFGRPLYRRFTLSGVGKLPEGSPSPANLVGYESPDVNNESAIVYSNGFVGGVVAQTRYVWLASTTAPLTQTLIDEGQYPHITDGANPEIVYVQKNADIKHWTESDGVRWVATALWADIVGTGATARIVYECVVNGYSQICVAEPVEPAVGTIKVETNLATAIFTITGPTTYSGAGLAFEKTDAPVGVYTITFGAVQGYRTPPAQTLTLSSEAVLNFVGSYEPFCTFTIAPTQQSIPFDGGIGAVNVTASDSSCQWNAASTTPWVILIDRTAGVGNGALYFSVLPNDAPDSRSGSVMVADALLTVSQEGRPAGCAVSPLEPILDPDALRFENGEVIDTARLTDDTNAARLRLEAALPNIVLLSAFRPTPYQEHLREVWDKAEILEPNADAACQALRTEVLFERDERHNLGEAPARLRSAHEDGRAVDYAMEDTPENRELAVAAGFDRNRIRRHANGGLHLESSR